MDHRPGSRALSSAATVLPGQIMASISELKAQLDLNPENLSLQVSILNSLISKSEDEEKVAFLKQKIRLLIKAHSLIEAETDIESLLSLENTEENKLLKCEVLYEKQDYLNCMTQLLKTKTGSSSEVFEKNVEELQNSSFNDSLYVIPNLPDLYASHMTFFPELRGKIVLQICSSAFQTYILISTCPHLAYKTDCPQGIYNCSEGLQLLEVSHSILNPVDFLSNQKISMVSCSDLITGVLNRSGKIIIWGTLPDDREYLILENRCKEILVGISFVCLIGDDNISLWGRLGMISSINENYHNIINISDKTGSLSCSDGHLLLLSNGKVYSYGKGEEGQLGLGDDITFIESFIQCDCDNNVTQVLCNNEVSIGITKDIIYVWGLINPLQLQGLPPIAWKPVVLDSFDLEHVAATLSKFELLILGKDQTLYSWIWKESNRLKIYRKLDVQGICMVSLRSSEAFLVKKVAIPQLTQIIQFPKQAYCGVSFAFTLALHDQYKTSFIPDVSLTLAFTKTKIRSENEVEYNLEYLDDGEDNTVVKVTAFNHGEYWVHIFVQNKEIMSSPMMIKIHPSPAEDQLLSEIANAHKIEEIIHKKKVERISRRQEARIHAEEDREKKMERTRKRAQEALRNFLENKERDLVQKEVEKNLNMKVKTKGAYVVPY